MQWKLSAKNTISKVIFSSPIALFLGVGVLVATDILQPSYFKNLPVYYPYFIVAMFVGYLAVFLARIPLLLISQTDLEIQSLLSNLKIKTFNHLHSKEMPIFLLQ